MTRRRRAITIVVGALALVLVAVGIAWWAARRDGRLKDLLARHRAEGLGDRLTDLLPEAPPVDAAAQRDLAAWAHTHVTPRLARPEEAEPFLLRGEDLPADLRTRHEDVRGAMEDLARLLENEVLRTDALAPAQAHLTDETPAASWVPPFEVLPWPGCSRAAQWHGIEACLAPEPTAALRVLDRLHEAAARPACLLDHLVTHARRSDRDRAYLRLAIRRRLPESHRQAWLAEPPGDRYDLARVLRSERLFYLAPRAHAHVEGTLDDQDPSYGAVSGGVANHFEYIYYGAFGLEADMALGLELLVGFERVLRGERPLRHLGELTRRVPVGYQGFDVEQFRGAVWNTLLWGANHRAMRLALRVLDIRLVEGAFPADDAALRARLGEHAAALDGDDWTFPLVYERLADDCFRIVVAPAAPLPPIFVGSPGSTLPSPSQPTRAPGPCLQTEMNGVCVRVPADR